jgi:hypothetical protein
LFRTLFHPTPPVQALLAHIWQTTPLRPNQYAVAHYRALWWENQDPPTEEQQKETAINAVHCASRLRASSRTPIYFATDSVLAQQSIRQYASTTQRPIVVIPHMRLVHLDRVNTATTAVEEIYPVFVDLWLIANGNCISIGDGGFGKYGLMLSQNYTCSYKHIIRHKLQICDWIE